MGVPTIEARLAEVVRAVLELDPARDPAAIEQAGEPAWDSLAHALLVSAVESEFGVEIDPAESMDLTSVQAIGTFLRSRLGVTES